MKEFQAIVLRASYVEGEIQFETVHHVAHENLKDTFSVMTFARFKSCAVLSHAAKPRNVASRRANTAAAVAD